MTSNTIEHLQYLRGLPLEFFNLPRIRVTKQLIEVLCLQVMLSAPSWDVTWNMKEIVVLCRELLASDISTDFLAAAFGPVYPAIRAELFRGRHASAQLVDEAIKCLRDAVKVCPPHLHRVSLALAYALRDRFRTTHSLDEYEEARALFEKVVDPNHPRENMDSTQILALWGNVGLIYNRAIHFANPESVEETIPILRSVISCASLPERFRTITTGALATLAGFRCEYHGLQVPAGLRGAGLDSFDSEFVRIANSQGLPIFENLVHISGFRSYSTPAIEQKILELKELLSNARPGTKHHCNCLERLAKCYETKSHRTNDIADIEESIKYHRLSLDAHSDAFLRPIQLGTLRLVLLFAFECTNKISYLDESIAMGYVILKLKWAEQMSFYAIEPLVLSLFKRWGLFHRIEDMNEVIRLAPLAIDDQYAPAHQRFKFSCDWAHTARNIGHDSTSAVYEKAMALMQDSLSLSPTIQIQHDRLLTFRDNYEVMPLDYASYQVDSGQLEEAIETLEQGRALLWSEMRGLRAPIADPIEEDVPLAKKLAETNQALEVVATSFVSNTRLDTEDERILGSDRSDAFGRLVMKQRKLLKERDALISRVQGRPGFERFWKTPSFDTLQSAASHGPVIIINHCQWRSDILILLSNTPPSLISTPEDFFDRASKLRDQLVDIRNNRGLGLDSPEYELTLGTVLSELYQLVGEPVIQRLRKLGIPEQSRIWWCPTSVFCSLPLHAMGPIPSTDDVNVKQYISDLYICSYTPTLSALIETRSRDSHALDQPSLLLVAQPDASLPDAKVEIKVIQSVPVQVTSLISEDATSCAVVDGLRDHQLVHFTCHGTLERARPFDASFELYGNVRLTLLEIVRSRLPSAEFAFLAACHTAELTDESIADEGLHLVAAMQYCGFRSVVGTMWAMADIDGPVLAKYFYKSMFSKGKKGVPYCERSAEALRDAVQKLRKKRGVSLERWVNFVHYGA